MGNKLNVLVYGSKAREQAIAEALLRSPLLGKLFLAEPCMARSAEIIDFEDFEQLAQKCVDKKIDLVIVGPEEPLCKGIADVLKTHGVKCIGVNQDFSVLESSKLFAKNFMKKHGILTAGYALVNEKKVPVYNKVKYPVAIKADGLCGGKGVVIANNANFAKKTIDEFLQGKFGEASKTILVEEFLQGEEASLISLWDGKTLLHFPLAKDFKKLNKSPSAANTGGMGAYCPLKINEFQKKRLEEYKTKLENALKKEKADFVGFIYSGLIWSNNNWYVLEYNVRMGDPEAQVILEKLETDFLQILNAASNQELDKINLKVHPGISGCLTIAAQGYPKEPKDGQSIFIPEPVSTDEAGIKVYYAGVVKNKDGQLFSKGGRILSLCCTSANPFPALKDYANKIKMEYKYFRHDIDILN